MFPIHPTELEDLLASLRDGNYWSAFRISLRILNGLMNPTTTAVPGRGALARAQGPTRLASYPLGAADATKIDTTCDQIEAECNRLKGIAATKSVAPKTTAKPPEKPKTPDKPGAPATPEKLKGPEGPKEADKPKGLAAATDEEEEPLPPVSSEEGAQAVPLDSILTIIMLVLDFVSRFRKKASVMG